MQRLFGIIKIGFFGIIWAGVIAPGLAQSQNSENIFVSPSFISQHWTVEDGLPVNSITKIIQSSRGYIWFGTYDGLVRFDGVRFKVFKTAEYDGLVSNRIIDIAEAPDSSLFLINTTKDLIQFKNGSFKKITLEDGYNGANAFSFFRNDDETLWIGTTDGLVSYRDQNFQLYHPEIVRGHIDKFQFDRNGTLWYRNDITEDLFRFDGETQTFITRDAGSEDEELLFLTLRNGSTLISLENRLYRFGNGQINQLQTGIPEPYLITDFFETDKGDVVLSTSANGLFRLADNRLTPLKKITTRDGSRPVLSIGGETFLKNQKDTWVLGDQAIFYNHQPVFSFDNHIISTFYDNEGGLWFGTASLGIFRLRPNLFKTYSEEEGVPMRNIYPVYEASDHSIWFGTYGKGPAQLKNGEVNAGFEFEVKNQLTRSILQLESDTLLVSLADHGIFWFDQSNKRFRPWDTPPKKPNRARPLSIESLYQDSEERLWAGSNHGLYVKENMDSKWSEIPVEVSNPDQTIRNISEAPNGTLWMATYGGGILRYKDDTFTSFTTEQGLSSNFVRYIHVDTTASKNGSNYTLWIGTGDNGLNRLPLQNDQPDFEHITIYSEKTGLYDNAVHVILPDNSGRFWMSGNKGISWVLRSDLERFSRGDITEINTVFYTEQDGLRNREANGGVQTPGIKSHDGTLWFPTQDGLVEINPNNLRQFSSPTPILIEETRSGNESIQLQNNQFTLEPQQRNFNISYTGINYTGAEKIHFKYRLKGFNETWTEVESQRVAFFTNVSAGSYQFEVLATNKQGEWNPSPVTASITILPFFHETIWFRFMVLAGIAFLIFTLVQYRTNSLKRREETLEQSIKERTAELESEKLKTEAQAQKLRKLDQLKSQFFTNITHEFRTPLTLIIGPLQNLLRKNGNTSSKKIHNTLRRALSNSRRLQRLIDQILDLSKLEAGEFSLDVQKIDLIEYSNNIAEMFKPLMTSQSITMDFQAPNHDLFIYADPDAFEKILANLLSNAIKFTSSGGTISLILEEDKDDILISISDTGIGIEAEELDHVFDRFYQADSSSTRIAEGTGIGLALVKNLVELHKGEIKVESKIGSGSTFSIRFKKRSKHFDDSDLTPITHSKNRENDFPETYKDNESSEIHSSDKQIEPDHTRPTVLVVEDNSDVREFIKSTLEDDFSVIESKDGEEALHQLREMKPDLIISDIMMPNMDGVKLNEELKKDPMLEAVPVIFLSAKAGQQHILEGLKTGVDDYLTKPFDAEILITRAQNIIEKRQLLRRHILEYGLDSATGETHSDPFLNEVDAVLTKKFADPKFGVSEMAEALHLDRTRLYRKLKKSADQSPQQYLGDFRMKQASKLLRERSESISEVGYACGFNNMAYFSKVFKKTYKVTPSEFQARQILKE
ncbi:MAG: ATP-binding protein [Balneolaceae bacterium]|nr:ATP-binding protein [Balneolaceae bacterium]